MSFFSKLLGGDFESNRKDGFALFAEQAFGEAKLAFERALSKAKNEDASAASEVREKINLCKIALAEAKIADADREALDGNLEMAVEYLEDAADISDNARIQDIVSDRLKQLESQDARELKEEVAEITDEKLLAIIAGTWTEPQAKEYATMPDELSQALLARHDEDYGKAIAILEELTQRSDLRQIPKYLWYELGELGLLAGKHDVALDAIDRFLTAVAGDSDAAEIRVTALTQKARALAMENRFDEAKSALVKATESAGGHHSPYLALGSFLRARGEFGDALEALEIAKERMGTMQPDYAVVRELGFTHLAMNQKDKAKAYFASVIQHLAATGEHENYDPETAVALAALHEESGDLHAAADLFRHLAVGSDVHNHFRYNLESCRLLAKIGKDLGLARRYYVRAREIANGDDEIALAEATGQALGF